VLATEKIEGVLGREPRPWQAALAEFLGNIRDDRES
jgi:hypothetical protein